MVWVGGRFDNLKFYTLESSILKIKIFSNIWKPKEFNSSRSTVKKNVNRHPLAEEKQKQSTKRMKSTGDGHLNGYI